MAESLQPGPASLKVPPTRGRLARAWDSDVLWRFRHSPAALVSAVVALVIVVAAVLAPWLAPQNPFDPAQLDLSDGFSRPMEANEITGRVFVLGTDPQDRAVTNDGAGGAAPGAVDGERQIALQVQGHQALSRSVVVMRSVPLSFQVARGASGPVSRGTSTDMSTKV